MNLYLRPAAQKGRGKVGRMMVQMGETVRKGGWVGEAENVEIGRYICIKRDNGMHNGE